MIIFFSGVTAERALPEVVIDDSNVMLTYYEIHTKRRDTQRRMLTIKLQKQQEKEKKDAKRRKRSDRLKSGIPKAGRKRD